MRSLIPLDKIEKSKFEEVRVCGEYVALLFSDGTACVFEAEYDDGSRYIEEARREIPYMTCSERTSLGLMTDEERQEILARDRERNAAVQRSTDRHEYERLKKMFEAGE